MQLRLANIVASLPLQKVASEVQLLDDLLKIKTSYFSIVCALLYGAVQLTTTPPVTESILVVTDEGLAGKVAA